MTYSAFDYLTALSSEEPPTELIQILIRIIGHDVCLVRRNMQTLYHLVSRARDIANTVNELISKVDEKSSTFLDNIDKYTKVIGPLEEWVALMFFVRSLFDACLKVTRQHRKSSGDWIDFCTHPSGFHLPLPTFDRGLAHKQGSAANVFRGTWFRTSHQCARHRCYHKNRAALNLFHYRMYVLQRAPREAIELVHKYTMIFTYCLPSAMLSQTIPWQTAGISQHWFAMWTRFTLCSGLTKPGSRKQRNWSKIWIWNYTAWLLMTWVSHFQAFYVRKSDGKWIGVVGIGYYVCNAGVRDNGGSDPFKQRHWKEPFEVLKRLDDCGIVSQGL